MNGPTRLGTQFLARLADEITLPESVYDRATEHYEAVGKWLEGNSSLLRPYRITIYPQGSIALGTAVRPLRGGEHDVDAVCLLARPPSSISQQELKRIVGDRLKAHQLYRFMLDPTAGGRRCWTLKYRESPAFHLDVLPAVPDDPRKLIEHGVRENWANSAIRITDKTTWATGGPWPRSNPKGFQAWFRHRMEEQLREAKMNLRSQIKMDRGILMEVEDIPDYRVRTPLQSAIQILKYHRDCSYEGDPHKPISIIITTLAGRAYRGEGTIADTLLEVAPRMRSYIKKTNDIYRIENPVDPRENFADKWLEEPVKARTFFGWLNAIEDVARRLAMSTSEAALKDGVSRGFAHTYGRTALAETVRATDGTAGVSKLAAASVLVPRKSSSAAYPRTDVPRRPSQPWRSD